MAGRRGKIRRAPMPAKRHQRFGTREKHRPPHKLRADGTNQANTAVVKKYKTNVAKGYVFGGTQAVPAKVYNQFVAAASI